MSERLVYILPEQVASRIAAGEVVERPASALKEMVENSLDARARAISVEIEKGGLGSIAVGDDGEGMGREDAVLSIRRHATSKIRDAADLFAIRSFGFRGEALASIASVARLRMQTRRAVDPYGVELTIEGGDLNETRACAIAPGTRLEVRDLFFNTPARLKFMKTVVTEQSAAAETMQRLALANQAVAFRLSVDGRVLFDLPRAASPLERIRQLFGPRLAERMIPFEYREGALKVSGLCTQSQESYPTPRMVLVFVNRRPVRDRMLSRAVVQAYQTLLPRGRHPAVAIFVELPPEEVDVNVHPMKTEVRFRRAGAVFELVYHALRARLADQVTAASPSAGDLAVTPPSGAADAAASLDDALGTVPGVAEPPFRPLRLVADAPRAMPRQSPLGLGYGRADGAAIAQPGIAPALTADAIQSATPREVLNYAATRSVPQYATLRVVGQLFAGFIALEGDDGLILIDQHAAHERVTYERLRAELRDGGIRTQALLTPATLELNPARAASAIAAIPELRAMGFEVEPFGPTTLRLMSAPAVFGPDGGARLLSEMIDSMGQHGFRREGEAAFENLLKTLACHGSVRAGRTLAPREIAELLTALDRTEFKTNCPHGRPVHIEFRRGQIERMFRR